jgi:predicted Ser/Thr protein kinase
MRKRSISALVAAAPTPPAPEDDATRLAPGPAQRVQAELTQAVQAWTSPPVGQVLNNRFVLKEELGAGGMGTVFKAVDLRKEEAQDRNPFVAVKVLNEDFRRHPEALKTLQREAKKAQALAHPNVINVHDFDRDGTILYMTMEYLPGRSLDSIVRAAGFQGMPNAEAFAIVRDIGAALTYAHESGIIHLDLKPANIIVADTGRTKVIDFGIARAIALPNPADNDGTVFDVGALGALTPTYASPEMLERREPDPRDDVFALACITYELLTGRHPFGRAPATEARKAGLKPAKPASLNANQWRALQRGLAFDRDARTPTVAVFIADVSAKAWLRRYGPTIALGMTALLVAVGGVSYLVHVSREAMPSNPTMSEVDSTAGMQARMAAALQEATRVGQETERARIAAMQDTARQATMTDLDRNGVRKDVFRRSAIEAAVLRAMLDEVTHQAVAANAAANIAATQSAIRQQTVDKAAALSGADGGTRDAASQDVARQTGTSNEAQRIAAGQAAALQTAEDAVAAQAPVAIGAAGEATEAAKRGALNDSGATTAADLQTDETFSRAYRLIAQHLLQELGYYRGTPSGSFGPSTRQAIAAFQKANALPATGILTHAQLDLLMTAARKAGKD